MSGHWTERHTGEWDGSRPDDRAGRHASRGRAPVPEINEVPKGAGFDQWLDHLTTPRPGEPADPLDPARQYFYPEPAPAPSPGRTSGDARTTPRSVPLGAPVSAPFSVPLSAPIGAPLGAPVSTPLSAPIDAQIGVQVGAQSDTWTPYPELENGQPEDDGGAGRGFLGSGWDDEPEPRPRRVGRLAIISTICMLLAVGATYAGIQLAGNRTALAIKPPASGCSSTNSCGAGPAVDAVSPAGQPTDSPSAIDPDVYPSTAPSVTPTPKAVPDKSDVASPTPSPKAEKPRTLTPSRKPPVVVDDEPIQAEDNGENVQDVVPPGDETAQAEDDSRLAAPQVALGFEVLREDEAGYSARLVIRNDGADLSGWTLELPVGGQVTAVNGVEWEQLGGTLVITPAESLPSGGELTIEFDADGVAEPPVECSLSEGECRVTVA